MIYLQIDQQLYDEIKKYTGCDYERVGDFVPSEQIISILKDLIICIHDLEEQN